MSQDPLDPLPATTSDPDWPRLARLFEQIVDLEGEARASALAALQADPAHAALLPRLFGLLGFHAQPDPNWTQGAAGRDLLGELDRTRPSQGERVGPWTLLSPLGEGGMGEVWLAERRQGELVQRVALKRMRAGLSPALVARFLRERRILARLRHPNIAAFVDAGLDAQGAPWLALEYIEGERLGDACARRQLAPAERVRWLLQVLDALDHAHRQLVVHRDLKPANVMVDAEGRVKLLDFGIARLLDDSAAGEALTATRVPAPLTPRYAAPEQLAGEPAGIAADLYSTGVLMFELLSGGLPFGERALRFEREAPSSLWQAYLAHSASAHYALSPKALRRSLRGDLQQIVDRALQTQPAERYPSAAAFAADLRAWLAQRPLLSRPTPWPPRLRKWVRRQPVASASLLLAALATVLGVSSSLWQARQATVRAAQAEAARRFLGEVFSGADPLLQEDSPPSLQTLLARGAERLRADSALDARSRVLLLQDLGRAQLGLDQLEEARALLAEAESLAQNAGLSGEERRRLDLDRLTLALEAGTPELAQAQLDALPFPAPGQEPQALDLQELALRARAALARTQPDRVLAWLPDYLTAPAWSAPTPQRALRALEASALMQAGRPGDALAAVETALGLLDDATPLGERVQLYETEVEALRNLLQTDRALARQREVIALLDARLGPTHARAHWARMMLCGLLIGSGALGEAEAVYRGLWTHLGPLQDRPALRGEALFGWGMVSYRRGEFGPARQRFREARALFEAALGADSHKTRSAREAEAMAQVESGEVDAGLATLLDLVAQSRALDDRARLVGQLNSLALARIAAEEAPAALPLLEESRALAAALGQATAWTQVIQARALRLAGHADRAVEIAEGVVRAYRDEISPQGGPRRAEAERELALALLGLPEPATARARSLLESVLDQRLRFLGEDSPLTRLSRSELSGIATDRPD